MSVPAHLPDAEYAVMQIIWESETPIGTMQVAVIAEPRKGWKFKTTQTLLRRLAQKGFLAIERRGKDLYYSPAVTREAYIKAETALFMEKIHGQSLKGFISALYADKKPSEEDLAEIETWFREKE